MSEEKDLFEDLKKQLLMIDPVAFVERYLTLDGKPFSLHNNGYKPFADIYRYIGIKALEPTAKPVILVKGRQVGGTTMACALEMYFMGSGIFGVGNNPPIRIIHAFPQLELAAAYSKTKLNSMILSSIQSGVDVKSGTKLKSYMQSLLDTSSATNDSLHFKQFVNGNHLWIESTGLDADRIMGRTSDIIFFDECFPYNQKISTNVGKKSIGQLYDLFNSDKKTPLVRSFNIETEEFEYKKILHAWKKGKKNLIELSLCGKKIKCTEGHKFLTEFGWQKAKDIKLGTLIKTYADTSKYIRAINEDQMQVILGSFLGDGHLKHEGKSRFRLSVIHSINQKEYCKWKANIFKANIMKISENGYAKNEAVKFNTELFGLNKELPQTKSSCPQWILDEIDLRGIAIWFMDDGSLNKKWNNDACGTLSTCSFDEDSQKRFINKFKSLGIDCCYKKHKNYYYIYFNKDGFRKLCNLIEPYIHEELKYKILTSNQKEYTWNNLYKNYGWVVLDKISQTNIEKDVYDIEVEDNHNFILSPNTYGKNEGGAIVHNCQKTTGQAIGNALKILTTAKYGKPSKGVQVFFGTPRKKGSDFHKMWQSSSQQYYYLGCESCKKFFPLYTPGSDDWEKIWLHGFIVKCVHCGFEQDKRQAAERGKWIGLKDPGDEDCKMIGFHINQIYMPTFTKEDLISEKPNVHPINTERTFQNEVLGEFFQGDTSPITPEEIRENCADIGRKFRGVIHKDEEQIVVMGIDYGARADAEQMANPEASTTKGQSYSTAVVLTAKGPGLLSIEFATKFKRNDPESKKGLIDQLIRKYSINLTVGDIGFSNDFSNMLHNEYGDKYLVSRAHSKVNDHVKYRQDAFPKEIVFERDFYIGELYEKMKGGMIRFPFGDYEKIAWLIEHCASMEIKPSISRTGDPTIHYVKGTIPNDGFMALLNAYIAYKFIISKGFTTHNPLLQERAFKDKNKPLAITGYIKRNM
jgi:hypothetical protein